MVLSRVRCVDVGKEGGDGGRRRKREELRKGIKKEGKRN